MALPMKSRRQLELSVPTKSPLKVPSQKQYEAVLVARRLSFDEHFASADLAARHQVAHQRLLDVEKLFGSVVTRRESRMFVLATEMFADGLCQLACANYRLAFYSLRAFLEISSAAVRFSAFELELRDWEGGRRDISWTLLSGDETGPYSVPFVRAFLEEIKDETKHYLALARRVYRECSEYVHANPSSYVGKGGVDEARANEWFDLCQAATTAVIFCFVCRYLKDALLVVRESEQMAIVEAELGHFSEVRKLLEQE